MRLPRSPSGIIGGLCRLNYPGLITLPNGIIEPAWSWDHYKLAPDFLDMCQRVYDNRAMRVVNDFWVSPFKHLNVNTKRFKFAIVMI